MNKQKFFDAVEKHLGSGVTELSLKAIKEVAKAEGIEVPAWLTTAEYRVRRGVYSLTPVKSDPVSLGNPQTLGEVMQEHVVAMAGLVGETHNEINFIPEKVKGYVPFGNFADIRNIVKSGIFYPVYITGLSGNGKTMSVEQACAAEKRECIRVNITIETDEDDLIGGFRLIDGHTVWQNGPVIVAMERGAVLLLDEIDLGSNKLMCLQPILEGRPAFIKKVNRVVHPKKGFTIIATANTKGKGSDDGRFIGTNVMNEAFLDRFSITFEQEYPPIKTEMKILNAVMSSLGIENPKFSEHLVKWADVIRKSFKEGSITEIITTRRLVDICRAYSIFGQDREKAITRCINRFDEDTRISFMDLYKKVDESMNPPVVEPTVGAIPGAEADKEIAF